MASLLKVFGLLMYKNLTVRKRHWKMTIFLQALVPVILFLLIQAVRDFSVQKPKTINESSIYPITPKEELIEYIDKASTYFYYVPQNDYTDKIMEGARRCLHQVSEKVKGFSTEDKMLDDYLAVQAKEPFSQVVAVIFEEYMSNVAKYKIRHSQRITNKLFKVLFDQHMDSSEAVYFYSVPFIQTQICIDEYFINQTTPAVNRKVSIQQMPYPPHVKIDDVDRLLRQVMCVFAVVAFLIPLCIETNYAAQEKFIGVNVLMAMNGVKLYQNLLSWLLTGVTFSIFYVVPIIIILQNTFTNNVEPCLYYGNSFLLWLLLTVHVTHLIAFGMHIGAYFATPRFVIVTVAILYTASFSLHTNMITEEIFSVIPYLGILFPNILLFRLLEELNAYESKIIGIRWSNIFIVGDSQYDAAGSVGFIFLFSVLGIVIHFSLAVYVYNVLPGKYGVPQPPLYFLKCVKKNRVYLDEEAGDVDYEKLNNEDFEPVAEGALTPGIQIRKVKKLYKTNWLRGSTIQALKGISMDLYKGQITALLGHNGAGKTTLMSILTGVTDATHGTVFINGKNIKKDLETIRNDLGLCPQENMVFPDLNVFEQLEFFGLLKGENKTRSEVKQNVNVLLSKLKLSEKRNVLPSKLSGGQKRRLCLGMALVGDASTVVLDEPTSGMDPETRRDTWDIILKMRGQKTILISTHNMEEADILGDRIAIVHDGHLKSYGTAMFLKKQYGHGRMDVTLSTTLACDSSKVISKFDPETEQVSVDSEKIVLSVPFNDALPKSLDTLESQKKNLGVTGISVSLITLEQVFLEIVKKDDNRQPLTELFTPLPEKLKGLDLYLQIILALYHKKLVFTTKNLLNVFMIIFLPIISVLLMGLSYEVPKDSTDVFPIRLDMYRSAKALSSGDNTFWETYKASVESFGGTMESEGDADSLTNALLNYSIRDIADYRNYLIAAAEFNKSEDVLYANAFYSNTAIHSVPVSTNLLSNALIKSLGGSNFSIQVTRQQLPNSLSSTKLQSPETESLSRVLIFCCFFFPTVAHFVVHPFQERETKVKQLQRMTGVSSVSYWGTMFTFDILIFAASVATIMIGFYIMDVLLDIKLYYRIEMMTMVLLLLLFGVNALLLIYIFTFSNKAINTVMTILSVGPSGIVLIQYLVHQVLFSLRNLETLHLLQKRVLRLIPYISLFHGQLAFFDVAVQNARCRRLPNRLQSVVCHGPYPDPCCGLECADGICRHQLPYFKNFEDDMSLEESIVYLSLTPILYLTILLMLEERFFSKLYARMVGSRLRSACTKMDEQVKKEKQAVALEINRINSRVASSGQEPSKDKLAKPSDFLHDPDTRNDSLFLVYELSKYYGKLMAVKEISFRVKQRECFGLLGVNGAGKSTTFRMLTGEEMPNNGNMYLRNYEIHRDRKDYLSEMGYCPQTDAMLSSLNTFDHLRLFALLRGIPSSKVDLEVNKWINRLNLNACMCQPSSTYSGGNKRRLSIAMALIGNPTLVLLDEPTTGVDPAARRSLWGILQSCQASGQAIILTSHSMEECEALCNRLVIMVKGELVCIGASQELKQRFGAGYDIHIKLNPSRKDDDVEEIKRFVESSLTCDIRDENLGFIAYHVTDSGTTWEKMYSTMKDLKGRYSCIEDYAVLSATLEQLFIQFARGAEMSERVSVSDSFH